MLNLMPKSSRPAGVVAGGEDDAAVGGAEDGRRSRRGWRGSPLSHQHPRHAIGGGHPQDGLHRLAVVELAVAPHHQGAAPQVRPHVEDRLDEVLQIVGVWNTLTFLRRPEVPGRWSLKGVV